MAAILLALGSAAVKARSDYSVNKRQKQIADAMEQYQVGKAAKGREDLTKYLDTITPEARVAEKNAITAELERGQAESVAATKAYETPNNFSGKVSDQYAKRVASGSAMNADRIGRIMKQLSVIGTPVEQQLAQGIRFGRAATDVDAANTAIRGVTPAYMGSISRVRPSIWEDFFSQGLSGASNAVAGGRKKSVNPGDEGYFW